MSGTGTSVSEVNTIHAASGLRHQVYKAALALEIEKHLAAEAKKRMRQRLIEQRRGQSAAEPKPEKEESMTEREQAVRELGRRMAKEEKRIAGFDTAFPAGTILSCSDCGEGLYKVTTRATTADIVLDDGTLLQPLNTTIPPRDAWKSLACVKCGGRVYKGGKIHTMQEGWK